VSGDGRGLAGAGEKAPAPASEHEPPRRDAMRIEDKELVLTTMFIVLVFLGGLILATKAGV
jgi:hypothetical protein